MKKLFKILKLLANIEMLYDAVIISLEEVMRLDKKIKKNRNTYNLDDVYLSNFLWKKENMKSSAKSATGTDMLTPHYVSITTKKGKEKKDLKKNIEKKNGKKAQKSSKKV